jgi:hypothetical protein
MILQPFYDAISEEIAKNPQYTLDLRMSHKESTNTVIAVTNKAIRLSAKDSIPDNYFPLLYRVGTYT